MTQSGRILSLLFERLSMAKKSGSKKKKRPEFEQALEHLKQSLAALESEELTLEESLQQYEAGIKHLGHCQSALKTARQKIEQLVSIDQDGQLKTKPFDGSASDQITSGTRRAKAPSRQSQSRQSQSKTAQQTQASNSPSDAEEIEDEAELRRQLDAVQDIDDSSGLF